MSIRLTMSDQPSWTDTSDHGLTFACHYDWQRIVVVIAEGAAPRRKL